ncbi:MAG: MFS transporter [Rhodospirillales bacterium]|nr:MFS transporter [Rhodospirillales bacterium]
MNLPLIRALRERPIALLWAGLATSAIGDQLFAVVLGWVGTGLFGGNAGYLGALQGTVVLSVALLSGPFADRLAPRRAMITADLVRAAMLVVVVVLWQRAGQPSATMLVAAIAVLGAAYAFFRPALQASLPSLASSTAALPAVNALLDTTERIARLLGPGLIGLLASWIPLVHFLTLDAASFLASSAAVIGTMRYRKVPHLAPPRMPLKSELGHGFRAMLRIPVFRKLLFTAGLINGVWYGVYFVAIPLLLRHDKAPLSAYATVISAYGAANLAATLLIGSRPLSARPAAMIFGGNIVLGGFMALIGFAGMLPVAMHAWLIPLLAACSSIGGPMQDITFATMRQIVLDRHELAAAVRAYMVMNNLGMLVILMLAPLAFATMGVPWAIAGASLLLAFVATLMLWRSRPWLISYPA